MNHIPNSWKSSFGVALVRTIALIAFWVIVAAVVLRLMAWADEGARNIPVTTPAGVNGTLSRAK